MARSHFGGTANDLVLRPYRVGVRTLLALAGEDDTTTFLFYDAETGGARYLDLLDADDVPIEQVTVVGYQWPDFQGPDGVTGMWADDGDTATPRQRVEARDLAAVADAVAAAEASATAAAASAVNTVKVTSQSLSAPQQEQARTNIDAPAASDVNPRLAAIEGADNRVALGVAALDNLSGAYTVDRSVIAIGANAMEETTASKYAIAIGPDAMRDSTINRDDIAIGESALRSITAITADYSQTDLEGTRMVGIGGNAGIFASSNYNEVLIGRNVSQCKTSGYGLVAIGAGALAGHAQYGLATPTDGGDVVNNQPWGGSAFCRTVAIGYSALSKGMSLNSVAVGGDALLVAKASENNTAIGVAALAALDVGTGVKGGTYTTLGTTGTYSQTTTTITVTITTHGLATGDWAYLRLTSGASQTFGTDQAVVQVAVTNANVFTVTSPISRTATGNITLVAKETVAAASLNGDNTAVGKDAGSSLQTGTNNTLIGKGAAGSMTDGGWNVFIGPGSGGACTSSITNNVIIGYSAYPNSVGGGGNVGVGASALRYQLDGTTALAVTLANSVGVGREAVCAGDTAVAVGYRAKANTTGVAIGNAATTGAFTNSVALGNGATNNADNRITLGNASIAQIRAQVTSITALSDERDKVDVVDTPLGLDFVERLRPVDYRKQPRETGQLDPTLRHGFLAQQVLSVLDDLGVKFGGVDTSDPDNLAMSYGDLIAPLVRAVQELAAQVRDLQALIARENGGSSPTSSS